VKRLVVISGPPCSGKSTLGEVLSRTESIPHFEMDQIRVRLMPEGPHTRATRRIAYRAMHMLAEALLRQDQSVIVNACYGHREDREEIEAIARATGARLYLIECHVTAETAIARAADRSGRHPGTDLTPVRIRDLVENFPFSGTGLTVDSETDAGLCSCEVKRYVNSPLA
jgi:predicted kinase